jgi:hypothetical protein
LSLWFVRIPRLSLVLLPRSLGFSSSYFQFINLIVFTFVAFGIWLNWSCNWYSWLFLLCFKILARSFFQVLNQSFHKGQVSSRSLDEFVEIVQGLVYESLMSVASFDDERKNLITFFLVPYYWLTLLCFKLLLSDFFEDFCCYEGTAFFNVC